MMSGVLGVSPLLGWMMNFMIGIILGQSDSYDAAWLWRTSLWRRRSYKKERAEWQIEGFYNNDKN